MYMTRTYNEKLNLLTLQRRTTCNNPFTIAPSSAIDENSPCVQPLQPETEHAVPVCVKFDENIIN